MPPPGMSAPQASAKENEGYAGLEASVEAAYRVGSVVVDTIVKDWPKYRDKTPE